MISIMNVTKVMTKTKTMEAVEVVVVGMGIMVMAMMMMMIMMIIFPTIGWDDTGNTGLRGYRALLILFSYL